jgi:hypothetical protein
LKEAFMRLTRFPRVSRHGRCSLIALAIVLGFSLVPVTSAVAQEAEKPAFAVQGDVGLIFLYVKAEKTADFEAMMAKLKEALSKSEAPEVKEQAAGLKVLKAPNGPAPAGAVLYMLLADPAVKNVEYWFLPILYKAFPTEAKAFYDQWQDVRHATSQVAFDLQIVMKMQ